MDTTSLESVLAVLLPSVVSVIKREHFDNRVNALIAMAIYAVFGLLAVVVTGQHFDINNIVPTVALFTTEGTVAYTLFWKNVEGTSAGTGTNTPPPTP